EPSDEDESEGGEEDKDDSDELVIPVYAKSCLKEKGCTDAGTTMEPSKHFGDMALFAQPVEDDCCGYGTHYHDDEVEQLAQSAKKTSGANSLT
ncbi:hypothetical protein OFB97_29700, partial [Escherichia coli]|nr:hypothetical protein [Escherichia coli]